MPESSERQERLSNYLGNKTLQGWNIVDRNNEDLTAVIALPGKKVNHVLHAILSIGLCGVWLPVWLVMYLTRKKEQRIRVTIDQSGQLIEETITL